MTSKHYTISGKPIPLARARITRFGAYDAQKKEKDNIRADLMVQHGNDPKWNGPIHLHISFWMPNCGTKKKQSERSITLHYSRPDLSNLIKFIEDAAQGILFDDDCIISGITASKYYTAAGHEPFTSFYITSYGKENDESK